MSITFLMVSGIANEKSKLYGLQFHPEVDLSDNGLAMMKNFLYEVAKCKGTYTMKSREAACIKYIRETTGDHKVLVSNLFLLQCLLPVVLLFVLEIFPGILKISAF